MAAAPLFIGTPKTWFAQVSAANTNRDGTGTVVTVVTAASGGTRIDWIRIIAAAAVTAGVVRLFLHDGTNYRLYKEIMVTATTPSASVETFTSDYQIPDGLVLPNGWSLRASTHIAETFNVIPHGGDF